MTKTLTLLASFGLVCIVAGESDNSTIPSLKINIVTTNSNRVAEDHETVYAGSEVWLICSINETESAQVWWSRDGLNSSDSKNSSTIMKIKSPSQNDTGIYTCLVETKDGNFTNKSINLTVMTENATIWAERRYVRAQMHMSAILSCDLTGYPLSELTWVKIVPNKTGLVSILVNSSKSDVLDLDDVPTKMNLHIEYVSEDDQGTYECRAKHNNTIKSSKCHLIVTGIPELLSTFVKSVGRGKVYLNWTINEHNEPLKNYSIDIKQKGVEKWETNVTVMGRGDSSHLLVGLGTGMEYKFRIRASNSLGDMSEEFNSSWITVLEKDPDFVVSNVTILEKSGDWITINWTIPPKNLQEYFQYYNIVMNHGQKKEEIRYCPAEKAGVYNFTNIENPEAGGYEFRVQICNNYTKECSGWSATYTMSTSARLSSEINVIAMTIFSLYSLLG